LTQDHDIARLELIAIPVFVQTPEGTEAVLLNRQTPLGTELRNVLGALPGWTVQVVYGGELDIKATVEENGIDEGATLQVRLVPGDFLEVLQDLLLHNTEMTETEATRGAKLDADGILISWDLSGCKSLQNLPESLEGCTALEELHLDRCLHLVSLKGITGCTALKKLSLYNCRALTSLPEGFEEMDALADLGLAYCHALAANEETYTTLSKLPTLTSLSLEGCNITRLPEGDYCLS